MLQCYSRKFLCGTVNVCTEVLVVSSNSQYCFIYLYFPISLFNADRNKGLIVLFESFENCKYAKRNKNHNCIVSVMCDTFSHRYNWRLGLSFLSARN